MKWMIASDIYGSAYYCRKLLKRFEEEQADRIILLGDLLYHGPRNDLPKEYNPKAVIEMLSGPDGVTISSACGLWGFIYRRTYDVCYTWALF